jgi:hypothetical protein
MKIAVAGHVLRSLRPLEGGDSGQGLKSLHPHLCAERYLEFWRFGVLCRSLWSLGAGVFGLEKYPEVLGQNFGRKMAKTHYGPEPPALKKAETAETKTTIT